MGFFISLVFSVLPGVFIGGLLYIISELISPSLKNTKKQYNFFKEQSIEYIKNKDIKHELLYSFEQQYEVFKNDSYYSRYSVKNIKTKITELTELLVINDINNEYESTLKKIKELVELFELVKKSKENQIFVQTKKLKEFAEEHALFKEMRGNQSPLDSSTEHELEVNGEISRMSKNINQIKFKDIL